MFVDEVCDVVDVDWCFFVVFDLFVCVGFVDCYVVVLYDFEVVCRVFDY